MFLLKEQCSRNLSSSLYCWL